MLKTESDLRRAANIIANADALVIAAGAGIGVDSGLPDFRGNYGFWKAYPALKQAAIDFIDIANPRSFETDPELAWGFYGHRLNLYRETVPHAGFQLLRTWAENKPMGWRVFTSNVDGHFQKSGFAESGIHECHGSIRYLQCLHNCTDTIWSADELYPQVDAQTCRLIGEAPKCPHCGGLARPNVMMFGDGGWNGDRTDSQGQMETKWLRNLQSKEAQIAVIELGAGTAIPSVRYFSHQLLRTHDAKLVRINVRESDVSTANEVGLSMGALEALHRIADRL
jgi:NAD-dependent SIR2 family protein deacetylase